MLNIFYGDMKEAVYNTASYFKYDYEEDWIVDPMVKEMIQDVDKSTVIDSGVIDSPVLGKIPPIGLSGGVKTPCHLSMATDPCTEKRYLMRMLVNSAGFPQTVISS